MNTINSVEKISIWMKIVGVFWGSPAFTLRKIARMPDFIGIGSLLLGLNLALVLIQLPKIKQFTTWTLQNLPHGVRLPLEQLEVAVNAAAVSFLVGGVISILVMWLGLAALLKLWNIYRGEKASFQSLFTVSIYASLPLLLSKILMTIIIIGSPFEKMSRITFSPAYFFPNQGINPEKMYVLLSQFDPFMIWSLILTALGGSLAMKVPFLKVFLYLLVVWLIYVAGLSLFFSTGSLGMAY